MLLASILLIVERMRFWMWMWEWKWRTRGARDVGEVEHRGRREDVLEVLRVRVLEAVQRRVRVVLREARLLRNTRK